MQTLSENFNILLVEDNPADLFLLEEMLWSSKLRIKQVFTASRLAEAKLLLQQEDINLVLLDLSLPDSFGIDSLREIRHAAERIPVIVLTGLSDEDVALLALKENAQDYLVKGEFNVSLLSKSIGYSIERKKVEEKILASEDKYRQMFYKNPFPMWINHAETLQILEVNDAAILKYGYERNEFLALTLDDIHTGPLQSEIVPGKEKLHEKRWQHRKKNGETIIVEFTYYPISYFDTTAMQAQVNDITENIRLENELNLKKQQLVEAVLLTQESERKKIGGELHDNINQILTAVKLNLGFAMENREHSERLIQKCFTNTSTAIEEIRKLSKELILPGNLKELGLVHSIEEMLKEVLKLSNIHYSVNASGDDELFITEEHKLAIYRIVQEQLNNILKHACASTVSVQLMASPNSIQLVIEDDGKGFHAGLPRNGIGITNIISRAELFNGSVTIDSAPGKGCKLEVWLRSKKKLPQSATPSWYAEMPN